ncbi:MAG: hypothetical protein ACKOJF_33490, partial [Planctomycetaceae bacterium]
MLTIDTPDTTQGLAWVPAPDTVSPGTNGDPSEFSRLASALAIWLAVLFHANGTVAVCPAALTTLSRKSPAVALVHHENVP